MTRKEVKDFIVDGVRLVNPSLSHGSGLITDWNVSISTNTSKLPATWLEQLESDTDIPNILPFDNWAIKLHIGNKDDMSSKPEEYEAIIDSCDEIAQFLIKKYNHVIENNNKVTISGISRKPFTKKYAACISGVLLSFTLTIADKTEIC